jgi:hypothetical protein
MDTRTPTTGRKEDDPFAKLILAHTNPRRDAGSMSSLPTCPLWQGDICLSATCPGRQVGPCPACYFSWEAGRNLPIPTLQSVQDGLQEYVQPNILVLEGR